MAGLDAERNYAHALLETANAECDRLAVSFRESVNRARYAVAVKRDQVLTRSELLSALAIYEEFGR